MDGQKLGCRNIFEGRELLVMSALYVGMRTLRSCDHRVTRQTLSLSDRLSVNLKAREEVNIIQLTREYI